MKAIFDDPQFSFQMLRTLSAAPYGGSDIGECLSTAYRIEVGNFESWYNEWKKTAERINRVADECLARKHETSAREAYLRAMTYYRVSEFYLHGDPEDPRIGELSGKSRDCFVKVAELSRPPIEKIEIPYEETTLPGWFYVVDDSGKSRPTLLLMTGFDGTKEELYTQGAVAATRRGFNCLTFEGPGQGEVIREQGLPFRPDWEEVITPVIDHALQIEGVDPDKIALMGLSFGGYLAPRAAAFEHRLAACIADGGVFDFMGGRIPEGMSREDFFKSAREYPDDLDKGMTEAMKTNTDMRWAVNNGMYTFKAKSPSDWMVKASEYCLDGVADKITCPTLVVNSEEDKDFPGEPKRLYDALTCPKEYMLFTKEEGAEEHCQAGAALVSHQRIFDWLQETLGI